MEHINKISFNIHKITTVISLVAIAVVVITITAVGQMNDGIFKTNASGSCSPGMVWTCQYFTTTFQSATNVMYKTSTSNLTLGSVPLTYLPTDNVAVLPAYYQETSLAHSYTINASVQVNSHINPTSNSSDQLGIIIYKLKAGNPSTKWAGSPPSPQDISLVNSDIESKLNALGDNTTNPNEYYQTSVNSTGLAYTPSNQYTVSWNSYLCANSEKTISYSNTSSPVTVSCKFTPQSDGYYEFVVVSHNMTQLSANACEFGYCGDIAHFFARVVYNDTPNQVTCSLVSSQEFCKQSSLNAIQVENLKKGDNGWNLTNPSQYGEIQAYTGEDSINRGGTVDIYTSINLPNQASGTYSESVYRLGYYQGTGGYLEATYTNIPAPAQGYYTLSGLVNCPTCITSYKDGKGQQTNLVDAHWARTSQVTFDPTWLSGIYVIKLTELTSGYEWEVPVVVRDDTSHSAFVYNLPTYTEQEYNNWGGAGGYGTPEAYFISFNRPYTYFPWIDNAPNTYTDEINAGTGKLFDFAYQIVRYAEQQGFDITYTSDTALSAGITNLANHTALINGGHNEYYTKSERNNVLNANKNGLSLLYLGGNDMFWQVRDIVLPSIDSRSQRIFASYKQSGDGSTLDPIVATDKSYATVLFRNSMLGEPEDQVLKEMMCYADSNGIGVDCSNGGAPTLRHQNMIVTNTNTWPFIHTTMHNGDTINGVIGYETDEENLSDGSNPTASNILQIASEPYVTHGHFGTVQTNSLIVQNANSIMFNAGSIYWSLGLVNYTNQAENNGVNYYDPRLVQITNNIFETAATIHNAVKLH